MVKSQSFQVFVLSTPRIDIQIQSNRLTTSHQIRRPDRISIRNTSCSTRRLPHAVTIQPRANRRPTTPTNERTSITSIKALSEPCPRLPSRDAHLPRTPTRTHRDISEMPRLNGNANLPPPQQEKKHVALLSRRYRPSLSPGNPPNGASARTKGERRFPAYGRPGNEHASQRETPR